MTIVAAVVRPNATNFILLKNFRDNRDPNAIFSSIQVAVKIVNLAAKTTLMDSTAMPERTPGSKEFSISLTKTLAPFVEGETYEAQFTGTMFDEQNNPVDYYETQPLVCRAHG